MSANIAGADRVEEARVLANTFLDAFHANDETAQKADGKIRAAADASTAMQVVAQVLLERHPEELAALLYGLGRGFGVVLAMGGEGASTGALIIFGQGVTSGETTYREAMTPKGRA